MYHHNFGRSSTIEIGRNDGKLSALNNKGLGGKEAGTFTIPLKGKKTDQKEKEIEQTTSPPVQVLMKMAECH